MDDVLALTRSRAKHPPHKTVTEARRIKGKVQKSESKKRRKGMDTSKMSLADMRAEIAEMRRKRVAEKHARIAGEIDEKATRLIERRMEATPEHYGGTDDAGEDEAEPVGSVHAMSDADYESQLKEAAKARGYDVG